MTPGAPGAKRKQFFGDSLRRALEGAQELRGQSSLPRVGEAARHLPGERCDEKSSANGAVIGAIDADSIARNHLKRHYSLDLNRTSRRCGRASP